MKSGLWLAALTANGNDPPVATVAASAGTNELLIVLNLTTSE